MRENAHTTSPRGVLVIQPNMSGHRFNYVRILLQHAEGLGVRVVVLTTSEGEREYAQKVGSGIPRSQVIPYDGPLTMATIGRFAADRGLSVALFLDGDRLLPRLVLGRRSRDLLVRVLVMRPPARLRPLRPSPCAIGVAKRTLLILANRAPGSEALQLVSALESAVKQHEVRDPVAFSPDLGMVQEIRQRWGAGVAWFLIAGAVDPRKHPLEVLEALEIAQRGMHCRLGLAIAGRIDPQVARDLHGRHSSVQVRLEDRHLTDVELDSCIAAADVVVIAHSNEGPSGVLGKAAAGGRKVLAAGALSLKNDCASMSGAVWTGLSVPSLARGVLQLTSCRAAEPVSVGSEREFASKLLTLPAAPARRGRQDRE